MSIEKMTADYKTELQKNGVLAFVPGGNSMWPTLKNRRQSVIVLPKTQKLKRFDVALYQRENGMYVLHRVIEPTEFGYIMCGDSQFILEKVNEDMVFGVMTSFYRGKKSIEVTDDKYIKEVQRLYGNEKRRKRKVKFFFLKQRIRDKIIRILRRVKNGFNGTCKEK